MKPKNSILLSNLLNLKFQGDFLVYCPNLTLIAFPSSCCPSAVSQILFDIAVRIIAFCEVLYCACTTAHVLLCSLLVSSEIAINVTAMIMFKIVTHSFFPFWFRYLAGTEEGNIHKCSCSYNEQYLENYNGHTVRSVQELSLWNLLCD